TRRRPALRGRADRSRRRRSRRCDARAAARAAGNARPGSALARACGRRLARARGLLRRSGLLRRLRNGRAQSLHQVDDRRLCLDGLGRRDLLAGELRLEQLAQVAAIHAVQLLRLEVRDETVDHLLREVELRVFHLRLADGLLDLRLRANVLREEERLEGKRLAARTDQAERLL